MHWTEIAALLGFLAASLFAAATGAIFKPGAWYNGLLKPSWVPPKWAFPLVWSILYVMMAVSAWMIWRKVGLAAASGAFALYLLQLVINASWSAVFFGLRWMRWAMLDIAALWLSVAATLIAFAAIDTIAAWLLVPYLLWVSIAAALNAEMIRLNPSASTAAAG